MPITTSVWDIHLAFSQQCGPQGGCPAVFYSRTATSPLTAPSPESSLGATGAPECSREVGPPDDPMQRFKPRFATMTMSPYDDDVAAWASEQAALMRAGRSDQLDLEHIAEEIEDVGKSERRELASRMAVLLAHLLEWKYQPERQSNSWCRTIKEQRRALGFHIK